MKVLRSCQYTREMWVGVPAPLLKEVIHVLHPFKSSRVVYIELLAKQTRFVWFLILQKAASMFNTGLETRSTCVQLKYLFSIVLDYTHLLNLCISLI